MFLAIVILAAIPVPTKVFTTVYNKLEGSIVTSASAPTDSLQFEDDHEVFSSFLTKSTDLNLCFVEMNSLTYT